MKTEEQHAPELKKEEPQKHEPPAVPSAEHGGMYHNFKTAFQQLVNGMPAEEAVKTETVPQAIAKSPVASVSAKNAPAPLHSKAETFQVSIPKEALFETAVIPEKPAKTFIAPCMEITGNIVTDGDVDILGTVNGDVTSRGHICLTGTVRGNLTANSAACSSGSLQGDHVCIANTLIISKNFEIAAKITAKTLEIDGTVHGNITAAESLVIGEHAHIASDVNTQYLSVEKGAILSGIFQVAHD